MSTQLDQYLEEFLWWFAIVFMLVVFFPVGIVLAVLYYRRKHPAQPKPQYPPLYYYNLNAAQRAAQQPREL